MCPIKQASKGYLRAVNTAFVENQTVFARVHSKKDDGKIDFSFAEAEVSRDVEQFHAKVRPTHHAVFVASPCVFLD